MQEIDIPVANRTTRVLHPNWTAHLLTGDSKLRFIIRSAAVLLLVLAVASCTHTAPVYTTGSAHQKPLPGPDWSRFRGTNNDGISTQTGINKEWNQRPPSLLWQQPLTDGGYGGFSVANGLVYIVDHSGSEDVIKAFDLRSGAPQWQYPYQDALVSNFGFSRSTPTVDGNKVYAYSRLGKLTCLDATTGKLVWQRDIITEFNGRRPGWDMACSPLIDGNKVVVYAGGADAALVALNKTDGQTIWAGGGSDKPGYSSPVLATINGRRRPIQRQAIVELSVEDW